MKLNDSQRLQKLVECSASSGVTLILQSGCAFPYPSVKTEAVIVFLPNYLFVEKSHNQPGKCFSDIRVLIFMLHGNNKKERYSKYNRNSVYMQSQHQAKCTLL